MPRRSSTAFAELDRRLAVYKQRLDDADDRVLAGEHDWVRGARIDSYHTVWFELHEDLLRMLGREREEAAVSGVSERVVVLDGSTTSDARSLGARGLSIAQMLALGLPVPPAFVMPIEECRRFHAAATAARRRGLGRPSPRGSPGSSGTRSGGSATPRRRCWSRSAPGPP